jgi:hypothetical protein
LGELPSLPGKWSLALEEKQVILLSGRFFGTIFDNTIVAKTVSPYGPLSEGYLDTVSAALVIGNRDLSPTCRNESQTPLFSVFCISFRDTGSHGH